MAEIPAGDLPPLPWLRAFEAAGRLSSFTAAGRELGLTQAAVSQQIRLVEERLRIPLFRRLHRGVVLTPAGAAYLPHIQAAFAAIARSTAELFGPQPQSAIRIRAPISFATLWLAPRLARFFDAFPATAIEMVTIHTPGDYEGDSEGFDIRFGTGIVPGRTAHRLTSERLVPAVAPSRLAAGAGGWPDLPRLSVMGARELWPDWFARAGVVPKRAAVLRCDSFVLALEAARAGAGILLASRPLADAAFARQDLVALSAIELTGEAGHFITHAAGARLGALGGAVLDWWLREATNARPD